mmetsp:Transcript_4274/g.9180  ORF Transcript_4274/g.9180 Transcript_4274/m.9180 type:complete len:263 (+) Transcript_4274:1050-1838(+)
MHKPEVDQVAHQQAHGHRPEEYDAPLPAPHGVEGVVEEYPEYQVGVAHVLDPVLAPGVPGEVVRARCQPSHEAPSLGLRLALKGSLIPEPLHGLEIHRLALAVFVSMAAGGRGSGVGVGEEGGHGGGPVVVGVLVARRREVIVSSLGTSLGDAIPVIFRTERPQLPPHAPVERRVVPVNRLVLCQALLAHHLDRMPPAAKGVLAVPHARPDVDVGLVAQEDVRVLDAPLLELVDRRGRRRGGSASAAAGGVAARGGVGGAIS